MCIYMVITTHTYCECEDNTSDYLLYVDADSYHNTYDQVKLNTVEYTYMETDSIRVLSSVVMMNPCCNSSDYIVVDSETIYYGPYMKTGMKVYENPDDDFCNKIVFKDSQWKIGCPPKSGAGYTNPRQDLTPPRNGWVHNREQTWKTAPPGVVVHKVRITNPPLVLSIQDESFPDMSGIYNLNNYSYNGYPSYHSTNACIQVQPNPSGGILEFNWYWEDTNTHEKVKISNTVPPSYTPAGWDGWDSEVDENKTLVLSNTLLCSTKKGRHFISKFHPQFCDKKIDCNNNIDEKDCPEIKMLDSVLITLSILLGGAGLFLMLKYSHMIDVCSTKIPRTMTNTNTKDKIIDNITLGWHSFQIFWRIFFLNLV